MTTSAKQVNQLKTYLRSLTVNELKNEVEKFSVENLGQLSSLQLETHLSSVIPSPCVPTGECSGSTWYQRFVSIPVGSRFFRVRHLAKSEVSIPFSKLQKERDAWNPPPERCSLGRLNKPGQPVLYTAPQNPQLAIDEKGVEKDDVFALIVLEATVDLRISVIGNYVDEFYDDLDEDEKEKLQLIDDFLSAQFGRLPTKDSETSFRITNSILDDWQEKNLTADSDGIGYPSSSNSKINLTCFTNPNEFRNKLRLLGVPILKCIEAGKFQPIAVAKNLDENGHFQYSQPENSILNDLLPGFEVSASDETNDKNWISNFEEIDLFESV